MAASAEEPVVTGSILERTEKDAAALVTVPVFGIWHSWPCNN